MAGASDCDGFNHSVAAEEKKEKQMEMEMALAQEEEEEHSVLDSAQETTAIAATATELEQPPPPPPPSADLEAKKQRLLEELESALLPSNTKDKPKQDFPPIGLGLGFEVIDETALVDTLSLPLPLPPPSAAASAPSGKGGKNAKKQTSSRRKAKKDALKHKNGNSKKASASSEVAPNTNGNGNGNGNGDGNGKNKNKNKTKTRRYSRKEMETLRFADVEKQRAFWNAIHAGLEPLVAGEYDTLLSVTPLPLPAPLCQLPNKKQAAPPILSAVCCENMDGELQTMESRENGSPVDPSCSHSLNGEDEASVLEECSEDDDSGDDYASIQRPAFMVDGEPNFDSGPPEDGWEYLRRVRWEADQIPRVKVAKIDRSKLNKEQSDYMPKIPDIAKCPEHLLPLKEWEDLFLAEFSALRANFSYLESLDAMKSIHPQLVHVSKQLGNNLEESASVMNKDVPLDYHLSAGEAIGQPPNLISEVKDATLPSGSKSSVDQPSSSSPTPPLLYEILGMDPVARASMLLKRISLLEPANTITRNDCMWLFALCATVDAPLDADTCAALRSLLRKCANIRAGKVELDDEVIMLNILATISGRYFGQSEN